MPNPQMPEGSPQEEQGESPAAEKQEDAGQGGGDQSDPTKVISTVQQALSGIAQAVQGQKGVPPEAQKHIENAMNEYNAFMKSMGSALGVPMGDQDSSPMGNQSADAAGNPNAVSADQPMRAGAKPMAG